MIIGLYMVGNIMEIEEVLDWGIVTGRVRNVTSCKNRIPEEGRQFFKIV